jgi:hypothetical protein
VYVHWDEPFRCTAQSVSRGPSRKDSLRALSILERLAGRLCNTEGTPGSDTGLPLQLSEALLPLLAHGHGNSAGGRRGSRGDEAAALRVLGVLAAVWRGAASAGAHSSCVQLS